METVEGFSKRIRNLRKEYGYKMSDVAKVLDVSIPTISSYEIGTRAPMLPGLVKIAKLYNCSTDYLLGLDNQEPETSDVGIKINVLKQKISELEEFVAQNATTNA